MSEQKTIKTVCRKCGGSVFQPKGRCVECARKYKAEWSAKNAAHVAQYRLQNRERDRLKEAEFRANNRDKVRQSQMAHIAADPEAYKNKRRAYYKANEASAKSRAKAFYEANKARMLELAKSWKSNNSELVKEIQKRSKSKARTTPVGLLSHNVSSSIRAAIKRQGYTKRSKASGILGCDWIFFKSHIERQFTKGMSWEKLGSEIHIDHIIPVDSAKTEQEVLMLNHFTNLRPMWAIENIRKSAKILYLL